MFITEDTKSKQTLKLFTMNIEVKNIYKSCWKC